MDEIQQPIDKLFPELVEGLPKGEKWLDLSMSRRARRLEMLMQDKLGVEVSRGGYEFNLKTHHEVMLMEASLRDGKPHPSLPVLPVGLWEKDGLQVN